MIERIIYGLLYLCGIFLVYYLIMWVLRELGVQIPEMVLRVIYVMLVLVACLVLYRLFRGSFGNLRLWPRDNPPSIWLVILLSGLVLSSCAQLQQAASNIPNVPPDPNNTQRIVSACMADGVFKNLGGRLALSLVPVPGVVTADQILAAGVDRVCANPEVFSRDISTAEWVISNLRKKS